MRLHAGDVHHQQGRSVGGDAAGDGEGLPAAVGLHGDVVGGAELRARRGVDEHHVRIERRQRRAARIGRGLGFGLSQPARRDERRDEGVEAQQPGGMRLPVAAAQRDRELDHRARLRDARRERDARVKVFGQQAVARPHAEVGRAAGRVHGRVEFRQGRGVDQLHGEGQRHTQGHGHDRRRLAPGMMAPLRRQQAGMERGHGQPGRSRRRRGQGGGQGHSVKTGHMHPAINPRSRRAPIGRFRPRMSRPAHLPAFVAEVAAAAFEAHHHRRHRRMLAPQRIKS